MPEPTIDALLRWVEYVDDDGEGEIREAIRAILEQHRTCQAHIRDKDNYIAQLEREGVASELEAIRAFVERASTRAKRMSSDAADNNIRHWLPEALHTELALMEKEANAETND